MVCQCQKTARQELAADLDVIDVDRAAVFVLEKSCGVPFAESAINELEKQGPWDLHGGVWPWLTPSVLPGTVWQSMGADRRG